MRLVLFPVLFLIAPLICGCVYSRTEDRLSVIWVKGYLMELALIFLPAFICAVFHTSLGLLTVIYVVLLAGMTAAAACMRRRQIRTIAVRTAGRAAALKQWPFHPVQTALIILAAALILLQAVIPIFGMHIDDDDATYVAMATVAVDTDTVMSYDPLTGEDLTVMTEEEFDETELGRYLISPLYAFYAVSSCLTGIRPAPLTHTWLPFFLTLMVYAVYAEIGRRLFGKRPARIALFLILLSMIFMASYYSVYTTGTFLLVRIWQGKGQFAGIMAPMLLLIFMDLLGDEGRRRRPLAFLATALIASFVMTPIGGLFGILSALTAACVLAVMRPYGRGRLLAGMAVSLAFPMMILAYYGLFLN